jgi:hypothetical protein
MIGYLVIILFLAFLVTEGTVEYFLGQLFQHVPRLNSYQWALMYVSAIVGVLLALFYRLDLIALLSQYLQMQPVIVAGSVGEVLTGLAIGRGANFVHDLMDRFFVVKQ